MRLLDQDDRVILLNQVGCQIVECLVGFIGVDLNKVYIQLTMIAPGVRMRRNLVRGVLFCVLFLVLFLCSGGMLPHEVGAGVPPLRAEDSSAAVMLMLLAVITGASWPHSDRACQRTEGEVDSS